MKRWIVPYTHRPTNYNPTHKALVEAETAEDAKKLVAWHLLEEPGREQYTIDEPRELAAAPPGRVIALDDRSVL